MNLEVIRQQFAPLLRKKDALRLCMAFGFTQRDALTLLYGDAARGIEPVLPRVPMQRLLGDAGAYNRWNRDLMIDKLGGVVDAGHNSTAGGPAGDHRITRPSSSPA